MDAPLSEQRISVQQLHRSRNCCEKNVYPTPSVSGYYNKHGGRLLDKISYRSLFNVKLTKVQCNYSVTNPVQLVFLGEAYCKQVHKF